MLVVYGCVEEVFPGGEFRGWTRFFDPDVRPVVIASLNGREIARASCDFDREDIGGRFGFRIRIDSPDAAMDLLLERLLFFVCPDGGSDGEPLGLTDGAWRTCEIDVGAGLTTLSDQAFIRLDSLVNKEKNRRAGSEAEVLEDGWHRLKIPTLFEVKADSDTILMDEEVEQWLRPGAAFVLDLSDGTFLTSTEHFRSYLLGPSHRDLRGIYETKKYNQLIYGSHHFYAFIGGDDSIQFQGIDDAKFRLDYHIDHQNVHSGYRVPLIARNGKNYRISYKSMTREAVYDLDGEVYFGAPIEPTNWGMWLIQGLQSAWRFRSSGQRGRLLTYCENFQRVLLDFIDINPEKTVEMEQWRVYQCEHLTSLQYSHDTSLSLRPSDRQVLEYITEKSRSLVGSRSYPKAIFISRRNITASKGGNYRPLLNEQHLLQEMERIGVAIVEPELLPFQEQVAIFNNAELVVGLGGAGLFNVVFCKPGTRVVTIESSTAFVDNHATLFASSGLEYGVVFGKRDVTDTSTVHYRWTVDVDAVVRQIALFI